MNFDPAVITVQVDRRAVLAAAIDLRHETILALATCRTILERMDAGLRAPELELRHD
jgi:hypothetical protein